MLSGELIPSELKDTPQWVTWRDVTRDGKPTKIPMRADGTAEAKTNDPATWGSFALAIDSAAARGLAGVGFVFSESDDFVGIDLDGCRNPDSGEIAQWARDIIVCLNSYSEVSPSLTGVKIFCRGKSPFDSGKKISVSDAPIICDKVPAIEIYSQKRFFTVTGMRLKGFDTIRNCTSSIAAMCKEHFKPESSALPIPPNNDSSSVMERARKYVSRMPPALAGQGGHNATYYVACVLVIGFALQESEAYAILCEYNQRCEPQWSERELRHKIKSAGQQAGPRGELRDAVPEKWHTIKIPRHVEPPLPPEPITNCITLADAAAKYLSSLKAGRQQLVKLGVADLDRSIGGGVAFGEVVVLAARPSHGKSAVALQCLHTAAKNDFPGLIISEEMSVDMIGKRTIQYVSDSPEEEWKQCSELVENNLRYHFANQQPIYIAENCRSADKAVATIEWFAQNKGVKIVAVDYAQLLQSKGRDRYESVTNTSVAIRNATSRLGIVTLFLCQLSREIEKRNSFVPMSSDLKESGQLEQDADVIVFLVWPHRIDPSKFDANEYQIFISKNRNRAVTNPTIKCHFEPSRQTVMSHAPSTGSRHAGFDDWNNR